jgi:isopentenyl-diphosphate Delta-isomerase
VEEHVIIVDEYDRELGSGPKLATHLMKRLHRAFSIFIFNEEGLLLLQRRALTKYHSAGLWSNSCCGHPRPAETTEDAAGRRLVEELGFACDLKEVFSFIYSADLGNEMFEHEFDHVLIGRYDGVPTPDPEEVDSWNWSKLHDVQRDMEQNPLAYTAWFRLLLPQFMTGSDFFDIGIKPGA